MALVPATPAICELFGLVKPWREKSPKTGAAIFLASLAVYAAIGLFIYTTLPAPFQCLFVLIAAAAVAQASEMNDYYYPPKRLTSEEYLDNFFEWVICGPPTDHLE